MMKKLVLFLLCAATSIVAHAQFSGAGSGTSSDPYQITNANELAEMAYFLGDSHQGVCFKLMNDIDLTQWIADNNPTQGWMPIGTLSMPFEGEFNGNNHTIEGLYINQTTNDCVGLFGVVKSTSINDLIIKASEIKGQSSVAVLIGYLESTSSSISNCSVFFLSIEGSHCVGGIIGKIANASLTSISNCHSFGLIENKRDYSGGILGLCEGPCIESMTKCSFNGNIKGNNYVGGLIGAICGISEIRPIYYGSISGSTNSESWSGYGALEDGEIKLFQVDDCFVCGDITGINYIGGLIGLDQASCSYTFGSSNGKSSGTLGDSSQSWYLWRNNECVSGPSHKEQVYNWLYEYYVTVTSEHKYYTPKDKVNYSSTSIDNSYYSGQIRGNETVGGIVGSKDAGRIVRCYSYSNVEGVSNVGGLVGYASHLFDDYSLPLSLFSNISLHSTISAIDSNIGRIIGFKSSENVLIGELDSDNNYASSMCKMILRGENKSEINDLLDGKDLSIENQKTKSTYEDIGWDFVNHWKMIDERTFPFLIWEKKVSSIFINEETATLSVGQSLTLSATILPENADNQKIEWKSSDERIATVKDGIVTAISAKGESSVIITATAKDGSMIEASCVVIVSNNNDTDPSDFENIVYMESFTADAGEQVELPILMKNNTADEITNFDFYLQLPDGISALVDEDGYPIVTLSTDRTTSRKHSVYGDIESDGMIHVYSSASRNTYFFSGTEGEVATITLKVADDAVDGIYHIIMRNISMHPISGEEPYSVTRFNFSAAIGDLSTVKSIADGESYSATENEHVDNLNYTRTFSSADKWQALYVPFSIPVDILTENGLEVAELNNIHMYDTDGDKQFDKTTLEFLYLTDGETEANYPYLIKADKAGELKLTLKDVELKAAAETQIECASTRKVFKIKGTYTGVSGADMFNNNYYAVGGGTLVKAASADNALKPQRWYMSIENKDGSPVDYYAPKMRIMINGMEIDEEETGIKDIAAPTVEDVVYTLDGRKMNASALPFGIYVKNHQKIIVR